MDSSRTPRPEAFWCCFVLERQVPRRRRPVYNYCFLPRTTTVDVHFAKYHYRRAPKDLVATSSSPNVNVYFHDCCKNNYFHDVREPLPSPRRCWIRQVPLRKRTCTTTSTTPVNVYFPRRLEPLQKCTLRRYNRRERPPWTECMC